MPLYDDSANHFGTADKLGDSMTEPIRVVIVGASSGLGRSIGVALADRGARVAFLARRKDRLAEAAAEAGSGSVAIVCDVTDETSCQDAINDAAAALGGIDALIYSTGLLLVQRLRRIDVATWQRMFTTNVIGAALVTAAAVPHLSESSGTAVYLSSTSASMTPPWPLAGAYVATKAALDKLVEAWRGEHPDVGFTRLAVGDCMGGPGHSMTELLRDQPDRALLRAATKEWMARGYINGKLVDIEHLVDIVEAVLKCGKSSTIPSLTLTPRGPVRDSEDT